jgi:hypothetical protein
MNSAAKARPISSCSIVPNRFQPHDSHIANPTFRCASHCREQRKPSNASGMAPTGKTTDDSDFEGLQFLLAPRIAAFTDADTGSSIDGVAERRDAPCKGGHFSGKLRFCRIQDHPRERWFAVRGIVLRLTITTSVQDGSATNARTTAAPTCPVPPRIKTRNVICSSMVIPAGAGQSRNSTDNSR